jgi:hypothetical protein
VVSRRQQRKAAVREALARFRAGHRERCADAYLRDRANERRAEREWLHGTDEGRGFLGALTEAAHNHFEPLSLEALAAMHAQLTAKPVVTRLVMHPATWAQLGAVAIERGVDRSGVPVVTRVEWPEHIVSCDMSDGSERVIDLRKSAEAEP